MKITIFGANGGIGRILVQIALDNNYEVSAYVRNKNKLNISHKNLTFVEGELSDYEKIKDIISKTDLVISTLGPSNKYKDNILPIRDGHAHIIKAMEASKKSRLITIGTPTMKFGNDKKVFMTTLLPLIIRLFLPKTAKEMRAIGNLVKESSLDWTIVRFNRPVDKDTGENSIVTYGEKKIKMEISRTNIAKFIFDQIESKKYIKSMPIIGS